MERATLSTDAAQGRAEAGCSLRRRRWLMPLFAVLVMLVGCTRRYYREFADRDVYRIEQQREFDWRWELPDRPVEADPKSRIGDKHDPDHQPIVPDDPAARPFQVTAGRPLEFMGWKKRGIQPVEDLGWMEFIPRDKDGDLLLNGPSAMRIALKNNRDYQTQVEDVYLAALSLTLLRFTYFPQLFNTEQVQFTQSGIRANESNQLTTLTADSLKWTFFSGAQIVTSFANQLVFEYNGHGFQRVNTNLLINISQPLLQGAWARNVTQPLSLQERLVLYTIRTFAEYRRTFYVNTISNYLQLLTQLQVIRNQESQVQALKRNLDEFNALVKADRIDPLQRDQVAQQYQLGRVALLSQQAGFQTLLDEYRVTELGLPPDFPVKVDESLLKQFELNDPRLDSLRKTSTDLALKLRQYDDPTKPPGREILTNSAKKLLEHFSDLRDVAKLVDGELAKWKARIDAEKAKTEPGQGPIEQDDRESFERQVQLENILSKDFKITVEAIESDIRDTTDFISSIDKSEEGVALAKLQDQYIEKDFRARLSELFVIQTQARVYLLDLNRVDLTVPDAISVALGNRLDLMNSLGEVTDAWRNTEAAGNQLLAGLNLYYNGVLATDGKHKGILRFDPVTSSHPVGIRFDAPIVRRAERNNYRAVQIAYQRARRAYMLNHDAIVRTIRLDMRQLNLYRRQFEIGREQLLIAARQVDQVEYLARTSSAASSGFGQSAGLNLSNALNALLGAKNSLIQLWVQYEVQRMGLYRDFDTMDIDAQGVWTNDRATPTTPGGLGRVAEAPDPVGSGRENLFPGPAPTADPADLDAGPVIPPPPPTASDTGPFTNPKPDPKP